MVINTKTHTTNSWWVFTISGCSVSLSKPIPAPRTNRSIDYTHPQEVAAVAFNWTVLVIASEFKNFSVTGCGGLREKSNVSKLKDVKCQKVKQHDYAGGLQKKTLHPEVHWLWGQFEGNMLRSSKLVKKYFKDNSWIFDDHHMWGQYLPPYVWTSSCQVIFINLYHSQWVWLFVLILDI